MSNEKAIAPSANATFLFNDTVASVEPKATVTIKSNAFIFESVLLPEILSKNTIVTYDKIVITNVLVRLSQLSKNIIMAK